ncbi:MAG: hypothetical protein ACXVH2_00745 [Methanobacterium sp.]
MSCDPNPYDMDVSFLRSEFAKWWKIPTKEQEEEFCERVAIMCENGNIDENEVRKAVLDRIIFK